MKIFSTRQQVQSIQLLRPGSRPRFSTWDLFRPLFNRKLLFWAGCLLVGASLLGMGGTVLYRHACRWDFFLITTVKVEGCRHTSKNEILAISGVDFQTNLLALNPGLVLRSVESHPWVMRAEISKEWPSRLAITIWEREPVALINAEEGLSYIDNNGFAFARVNEEEDIDYPVITYEKPAAAAAAAEQAGVQSALLFLRYTAKGNSFLPMQNISEIHLAEDKTMVVYLLERPFAIYLRQDEIKTQYYRLIRVLRGLYKSGEFEQTAFINMNYMENKVLVRMAGTGLQDRDKNG